MRKKILLAEDNEDIAGALKILIEREGYDVVVAVDGRTAVDATVREMPDLILMDLAMPGMDGEEATREIRSLPEGEHVPIVCVTSYAHSQAEIVLKAGCNEVMSKTDLMASFEITLRKYLGAESGC